MLSSSIEVGSAAQELRVEHDTGSVTPGSSHKSQAQGPHCCRLGHNELEDASTTQPLTCALIQKHPPLPQIYAEQLHAAGVLSREEAARMQVQLIRSPVSSSSPTQGAVKDSSFLPFDLWCSTPDSALFEAAMC